MKRIIIFIFVFVLISSVLAVPSLPNIFTGIITYTENPGLSLVGYEINASIDGNDLGVLGEVELGNGYSVAVDPGGKSGTITFYIGGVEASPTVEYEKGEFTDLDLEISELPSLDEFCGNGVIDSGEQCDGTNLGGQTCTSIIGENWTGTLSCDNSCLWDISGCSLSDDDGDDGGNGGGGGGGGGSSSDEYYCGDGFCKTSEENETSCPQDCGVAEKLDVIKVENKAEKQDDKITNLNGKSPITGAVIGSNNSNLLIPVLFIGVLCLAGVIVFVFKRKP